MDEFPTLWLRRIPNLEPPLDPLGMDYMAMQASSDGLFFQTTLRYPLMFMGSFLVEMVPAANTLATTDSDEVALDLSQ